MTTTIDPTPGLELIAIKDMTDEMFYQLEGDYEDRLINYVAGDIPIEYQYNNRSEDFVPGADLSDDAYDDLDLSHIDDKPVDHTMIGEFQVPLDYYRSWALYKASLLQLQSLRVVDSRIPDRRQDAVVLRPCTAKAEDSIRSMRDHLQVLEMQSLTDDPPLISKITITDASMDIALVINKLTE